MNEPDTVLLGQILLGVLAVAGFSLQIWMGILRRKWYKQDRINEQRAVANRAEEVAGLAIRVATDLATKADKERAKLQADLAHNTVLTLAAKDAAAAAYTEANHMNAKIALLAEDSACRIPAGAQLDHIQGTTDETLDLVKENP